MIGRPAFLSVGPGLGLAVMLGAAGPAMAQVSFDEGGSFASEDASGSLAALVADGYEIKAAAPNGAKYVVFLQKDKKAYACEFVSLARSRCGEIR